MCVCVSHTHSEARYLIFQVFVVAARERVMMSRSKLNSFARLNVC